MQAALKTVDVATLVEYANSMGDKSLGSRLGYLPEVFDRSAKGRRPELVEGLIRSVSPVKLDPTRPRVGYTVPRWQIILNVPESKLLSPGVG